MIGWYLTVNCLNLVLNFDPFCSQILIIDTYCLSYFLSFQALSIYQNRDFITIYHAEQEGPNDFDTVLLKALVGGIRSWKWADNVLCFRLGMHFCFDTFAFLQPVSSACPLKPALTTKS